MVARVWAFEMQDRRRNGSRDPRRVTERISALRSDTLAASRLGQTCRPKAIFGEEIFGP